MAESFGALARQERVPMKNLLSGPLSQADLSRLLPHRNLVRFEQHNLLLEPEAKHGMSTS
jgi:hypothetical protein